VIIHRRGAVKLTARARARVVHLRSRSACERQLRAIVRRACSFSHRPATPSSLAPRPYIFPPDVNRCWHKAASTISSVICPTALSAAALGIARGELSSRRRSCRILCRIALLSESGARARTRRAECTRSSRLRDNVFLHRARDRARRTRRGKRLTSARLRSLTREEGSSRAP